MSFSTCRGRKTFTGYLFTVTGICLFTRTQTEIPLMVSFRGSVLGLKALDTRLSDYSFSTSIFNQQSHFYRISWPVSLWIESSIQARQKASRLVIDFLNPFPDSSKGNPSFNPTQIFVVLFIYWELQRFLVDHWSVYIDRELDRCKNRWL